MTGRVYFFADVTGVTEIFANVTPSAFDDVTSVVNQIFFVDVTANRSDVTTRYEVGYEGLMF